MLQAYRATPHPATKETPYELMMNRQIRTKIENFPTSTSPRDEEIRIKDSKYKEKVRKYHDKRRQTREHKIKIGDAVIVKRETKRKVQTPYEPFIYIVTGVKGSTIYAKRLKDGKTTCRDASRIKPLKTEENRSYNEKFMDNPKGNIVVPLSNEHSKNQKTSMANAEMTERQGLNQAPIQLRRSNRNRVSTFDTQLRDYHSK